MNTGTNEKSSNRVSHVQDVFDATEKAAGVALDLNVLKKRVERAVEDAVTDTRRAIKNGKHTFEDTIDDATYLIKKNPWQSVGYAAGAGIGVGLLAGWLMTRRSVQ